VTKKKTASIHSGKEREALEIKSENESYDKVNP